MENKNGDEFQEVEKKAAENLGVSLEEFNKTIDKKIVTYDTNKNGQELFLFRQLSSVEFISGCYNNNAKYSIFDSQGQYIGYVEVMVSNTRQANQVEVQYNILPEFKNKGNATICLEAVLGDIFVSKSFDDMTVKSIFPKTNIQKAFLSISSDNIASQAVAKKSGFKSNNDTYEITREEFLERLQKSGKSLENSINSNEAISQPSKREAFVQSLVKSAGEFVNDDEQVSTTKDLQEKQTLDSKDLPKNQPLDSYEQDK